jgi:hypothetical protein
LTAAAAAMGLTSSSLNLLFEHWVQTTAEQYQDTDAKEDVLCQVYGSLKGSQVEQVDLISAFEAVSGNANMLAIADACALFASQNAGYVAFILAYRDGIDIGAAGLTNPCPCDEFEKYYLHDFSNDIGIWTIILGDVQSDGVHGVAPTPGSHFKRFAIRYTFPHLVTMKAARWVHSHVGAIGNGSNDYLSLRGWTDVAMTNQTFFAGGGFHVPDDHQVQCDEEPTDQQVRVVEIQGGVEQVNFPSNGVILHQVEFWLSPDANIGNSQQAIEPHCV